MKLSSSTGWLLTQKMFEECWTLKIKNVGKKDGAAGSAMTYGHPAKRTITVGE